VVKNRLARLAVKDLDLGPLGGHFKGPTGLVFTTKDPVPVAKALQNFVRVNPLLTIKVGFVEGKLVQPAELKALADLPSKETLRSQLVGALQGPASQLVSLLTAPQRELVRVLEARSQSAAQ
jgi:large subunit ribosomal protein L10